MRETAVLAPEYARRAEQVMQKHPDVAWIRDMGIRIGFLRSDREKKSHGRPVLGECIKVNDLQKALIPYDFLIVIYEVNTEYLVEWQIDVLIYHELLHVGINNKGDTYVIRPHDLQEFEAIARRYGIDWADPDRENAAEGVQGETKGENPTEETTAAGISEE
ncbi:MAG: hypothetical protein IJG15_04780 [Lachnospiraceae bacterium]|nr:hypothetical protein [Lachnospiraceae bacterium]